MKRINAMQTFFIPLLADAFMNKKNVAKWWLLFSLLGVIVGAYLIYNALSLNDSILITVTSIQEIVFFVSLMGAYLYKIDYGYRPDKTE